MKATRSLPFCSFYVPFFVLLRCVGIFMCFGRSLWPERRMEAESSAAAAAAASAADDDEQLLERTGLCLLVVFFRPYR